MTKKTFNPESVTPIRFCALESRSPDLGDTSPHEASVIVLALRAEGGFLHLLVHPDWRGIVQPIDHEYIAALLDDFRERARLEPAALFEQISSLGVGPIVTYRVGSNIEDHPLLLGLFNRFVGL